MKRLIVGLTCLALSIVIVLVLVNALHRQTDGYKRSPTVGLVAKAQNLADREVGYVAAPRVQIVPDLHGSLHAQMGFGLVDRGLILSPKNTVAASTSMTCRVHEPQSFAIKADGGIVIVGIAAPAAFPGTVEQDLRSGSWRVRLRPDAPGEFSLSAQLADHPTPFTIAIKVMP